jgi:hypothetical protein
MGLRVALVRTDVSEERAASIIRVERSSEPGTTLALTCSVLQSLDSDDVIASSLVIFALMMEAIHFSETSILTRTTQCHVQETTFFIVTALKSYIILDLCFILGNDPIIFRNVTRPS